MRLNVMPLNEHQAKSDEELAVLTLENQVYLAELIRRYQDKLARYVRRISSFSEEDIEDILQEIFLKVYRNLNDFDHNLKFSSWIYRIAHNQVISAFRKHQARPQGHLLDLDEAGWNRLSDGLDIEKDLDRKLLKDRVEKSLKKLDRKYREVLVLKYLEEKDYKEISDILKKPIGTVASLISRAKEKFAQAVREDEIKSLKTE